MAVAEVGDGLADEGDVVRRRKAFSVGGLEKLVGVFDFVLGHLGPLCAVVVQESGGGNREFGENSVSWVEKSFFKGLSQLL